MGTTMLVGRAFLEIQDAFSEMERNIIRQRVKERIIKARARGWLTVPKLLVATYRGYNLLTKIFTTQFKSLKNL